ncbi:autotransporter domain-containing protein [Sutterella wadsworthensis]|uniref:autotransporter domain-containing protein n=2 Tax=Sutterella wadsworthensis TaxID=40545 RepID=UPI00266C1798|nr:autotransporter domain-containing protein [Sutterella wadsworthensis]
MYSQSKITTAVASALLCMVAGTASAQGLTADNGQTATNTESIVVTDSSYGMQTGQTVPDGGRNTLINNGTITVEKGYGIGLLYSSGTVQNNGVINAKGGTAIIVNGSVTQTPDQNQILLGEKSATTGMILVQAATKTEIDVAEGAVIDGRIVVQNVSDADKNKGTLSGTVIKGYVNISNQTSTYGGAVFMGDATGELSFVNSTFSGNKVEGDDVAGGAVYNYGTPFKQVGGEYSSNTAVSTGYQPKENKPIQGGAIGGAIMLKGNPGTVFEDVVFKDNTAVAHKTETSTGGVAYGGALLVDYSTGHATAVVRASDVEFHITKDMTYSGNTVSSNSSGTQFDTYGYHVPFAQAGGFLFLDRGSEATFNVDAGATLTIGSQVTTDDTDSIASSIPNTNTSTNSGKHAKVAKTGAGELVVNSSFNKYYGTVEVQNGKMTVNSAWALKNAVNVENGATLALKSFTIDSADKSGNQDVSGSKIGGSILVKAGGTLETSTDQVFTQALDTEATVTDAGTLKLQGVTFQKNGALALTDDLYNLAYAESASKLITDGHVVMLGSLIAKDQEGIESKDTVTLDDLANVGPNVTLNSVTVQSQNKNLQIGGVEPTGVAYRAESLSVAAVDLGTGNTVTVDGGKTLNLTGSSADAPVVKHSGDEPLQVVVKANSTVELGGAVSQGGILSGTVDVKESGTLLVHGSKVFTVEKAQGAGTIAVGSDALAGTVVLKDLSGFTGMIFVDPEWKNGVNPVSAASHVVMSIPNAGFAGYEVSARNSMTVIGANSADADAAFNRIAGAQNIAWKDDVTAALYAAETIRLNSGSILIDGSLTNKADAPVRAANQVTVAAQGMLIIDQQKFADSSVVEGNLVVAEKAFLGVANAAEGTVQLTTENGTVDFKGQVLTDNPFITARVDESGRQLINTLDASSGLEAVSSLGIQAMTRRADFKIAEAVANHTAMDTVLTNPLNLWVDVSGEQYKSDDLKSGGEFKADMGYAVFGADFAVADTWSAGVAVHYGTGTLRSPVAGIHNEIDTWGVALYGTKSFNGGACKLVGELAYTASENDITASQTALNQKVDAKIYSVGLRGQHIFALGALEVIPSIGVRVSRLETDSMSIGEVRVSDQDQTFTQIPLSVTFSGFEGTIGGWTISPRARVAYVPTFGDKSISIYSHETDVIDTNPVQGDFGLRAVRDNLQLSADIQAGAGSYGTTAVGARVGLNYTF